MPDEVEIVVHAVNRTRGAFTGAAREVERFQRDTSGRLRDINGRFVSTERAARSSSQGIGDTWGSLRDLFPSVGRAAEDLGSQAGQAAASLGKGGGGAGVGGGLAAALGVAGAAALSALPALGAFVPMLAGVGLAAGTLSLGFHGVSDALEQSGKNAKKYQQDLAKMSPASRAFTEELVSLKKEFGGIGRQVQKAMLPSFTAALKAAGPEISVVRRSMVDLAGAFGKAATGVGRMLRDSGFQKDFAAVLKMGTGFVTELTGSLGPLIESVVHFGAASKPTLDAFAHGMSRLLSAGIPGFFKGLESGISGAARLFDGLMSAVDNVLPSLGRFSGAFGAAFGPLFGSALKAVGELVSILMDALAPAIRELTPATSGLGDTLETFPGIVRPIAEALGKGLAFAVRNLVPVFRAGYVVLSQFGAVVGELARAITPAFTGALGDTAKSVSPMQEFGRWVAAHREDIRRFFEAGADGVMRLVTVVVKGLPAVFSMLRSLADVALTAFGVVLRSAATAFAWIPGIGPKLRAAAAHFDEFKSITMRAMDKAGEKIREFSADAAPRLTRNRLVIDISTWERQIDSAKRQLRSVPPSRRAHLKATITDLERKVARARAELNALNGKTAWTRIVTVRQVQDIMPVHVGRARGGIIGAAAGGGPRSNLTLVGEQGPELVDLAPGSTVHTAGDSARMLATASGAGSSGVLHITLNIGQERLGELIIDPLRKAVTTRGGNVQAVLGRAS